MGRQFQPIYIVVLLATVSQQRGYVNAQANDTVSSNRMSLPPVSLPNTTSTDVILELVTDAAITEPTEGTTPTTRTHQEKTTTTAAHVEQTTPPTQPSHMPSAPHGHPGSIDTTKKSTSSHSTVEEHKSPTQHGGTAEASSSHGVESVVTTQPEPEPYSWWKIVVALVIFCSMAGIILWVLKLTEHSNCRNRNGKGEDQSDIEENSDTLSEKISTSRV